MAQTSTTLISQKTHKADITVEGGASFTVTGSEYKISTVETSLSNLAQFDLITVSGTTNNNKTFTVKSVATDGLSVVVEELVTAETRDGSTDTTIDHVGFVSDKQKGDGYFSQPDGVHTVAYKVDTTLTGSIKMQGSLATTPTEDDYFDISGTTFTTDQSTTISSANFTGNFVWVRAKATGITAGSITNIQLNN
tara:strand:+ start:215 stop:796 length:582 start_codon:yes stop_codon:yes gene_type:complete